MIDHTVTGVSRFCGYGFDGVDPREGYFLVLVLGRNLMDITGASA